LITPAAGKVATGAEPDVPEVESHTPLAVSGSLTEDSVTAEDVTGMPDTELGNSETKSETFTDLEGFTSAVDPGTCEQMS